MIKVKQSQIIDEVTVCPYCMDEVGGKMVCCGEVHFERGYLVEEFWRGKPCPVVYLPSEIIIDNDINV